MTALERNVPLTEIVQSTTAAWCWIHLYSAALAALTIEAMESTC